ncbi:MAG TPA: MarR family transcriptional regulator [Thermaerobacter sp.]
MTGWEILQHIWRLQNAVFRDATPCLERHGLFRMAPFVLAMVKTWATPSAIAAALGLPLPTLSHILRRLEEEGWVSRRIDPADRRRHRFSLTHSGERVLQEARGCLAAAMEGYVARLDEREQVELLRLLGEMLDENRGEKNRERQPVQ